MIGNIVLAFGLTMLAMFALVFLGSYLAKRHKQRQLVTPPVGGVEQSGGARSD